MFVFFWLCKWSNELSNCPTPGEISLREFIEGLLKLRQEMIVLETWKRSPLSQLMIFYGHIMGKWWFNGV